MTSVESKIADLTDAQRRLLASLTRPSAAASEPSFSAAPDEGVLTPMSHAQRRLWLVDSLTSGSAFNVPILYRVTGHLDPQVLDRSLTRLVRRHAALRTVFPGSDAGWPQLVGPVPVSVLTHHRVDDMAAELRDEAAMRIVRAEAATTFDLATGPVFRSCAVKVAEDEWLFLLNIHHIACDQLSMGVFMQELEEIYTAEISGRDPGLCDIPVTYTQYAAEQVRREEDGGFTEGLAYWQQQLAGMQALTLPTDRSRPATSGHRGAEAARWLPAELSDRVRACATGTGTSPFMVMLAAFLILMRGYARTDDVAVGSTAAGRETDELAKVVGFFVNTIVLRTSVSGAESFEELLARVRSTVVQGHLHADVPFELVVEALDPARNGAGAPLTPVMFQQDNTPDQSLRLAGAHVELVDDFDAGTSKYDLLVSVRTRSDGTRVHIQYDTELFDADTITRMLDALETILDSALAEVSTPVAEISVLGTAERAELERRNDTDADFDWDRIVHTGFMATAQKLPGHTAVVDADGKHVTFAEVERRARAVATALRARGVRRGQRVSVQLAPSSDYLAAVLGTMMCGAAFVPIDPGYPQQRIAFIRTKAGVAAHIGGDGFAVADLVAEGRVAFSNEPLETVTGREAAYVIYTSGSTGEPKGVVVTHGGIMNNLADLADRLSLQPDDTVMALSSPSFDMSIFEMLGVTLAGGSVVIPDAELRRDPSHWEDLAVEHGVTVWNSAPALLDMFLTQLEGGGEELPPLRTAVVGGDWLPISVAQRFRSMFADARLNVLGGATEASIHSTFFTVDAVDPQWRTIPYGRPMANQRALVVNSDDQLCPIGVAGDLLIGGRGLAAGYADRPDLTAEKFIDRAGERWYRTGDLARWGADGELELLGRTDFMLKINGLRVEPGEVESAVKKVTGVDEVAVVGAPDGAGDTRLVAFLRSDTDAPSATEVKAALAAVVPAYLIPVQYVAVSAFPLSPNGKVDRRALTQLATSNNAVATTVQVLPETPTEVRIAAAWEEVLGRSGVGRDDDFFDLGGDSFKAVRAARAISGSLPTIEIFRHSTVAALGNYIDHHLDEEGERPLLVKLSSDEQDRDDRPTLVCLPYGGGNAVAYQPLADALGDEVQVWAVDLPGHDLSDPSPVQPITDVAARCAQEILDRQLGDVMIYGQCAGCATAVETVRALEALDVSVSALFVGAALPDRDPEQSMQMVRDADDGLLLGHMRGLGGFSGVLSESDVEGILRVVRHDLRQMVEMYLAEQSTPLPPTQAPVHCLIGSADPATPDYQSRYRDWGRYGSSVALTVIDGGDHYFCKHKPEQVAKVLLDRCPARH